MDEIPTTRNIVEQNPSLLALSLRVQEMYEFSISDGRIRPESMRRWRESDNAKHVPISLLVRFLDLRM